MRYFAGQNLWEWKGATRSARKGGSCARGAVPPPLQRQLVRPFYAATTTEIGIYKPGFTLTNRSVTAHYVAWVFEAQGTRTALSGGSRGTSGVYWNEKMAHPPCPDTE
jgi:hypothetical protein